MKKQRTIKRGKEYFGDDINIVAPPSDRARLLAELESLERQEAAFDKQLTEAGDADNAARINYEMAHKRNLDRARAAQNALGVLRVQIQNCRQELSRLLDDGVAETTEKVIGDSIIYRTYPA